MDDLWVKIISWAITAILGGVIAWLSAQLKKYKKFLGEEQDRHIVEVVDNRLDEKLAPIQAEIETLKNLDSYIDESLEPIREEIVEMHKTIEEAMQEEEDLKGSLMTSYKFRLIQLCKRYIKQGYITQGQYDQLVEFYKTYVAFGGNGQGELYYKRAVSLEIRDIEGQEE